MLGLGWWRVSSVLCTRLFLLVVPASLLPYSPSYNICSIIFVMHTHSHCLWIRADWASSELRPQQVTQGHSADYSHKITRCSSRSYQLLCLVTATPEFYLVSFWVTGPRAVAFTFGNVWRKMKGSRLRAALVFIPISHRFHSWLSLFSPSQGRNPFFLEPSVIITITDGNKLSHSSGVSDEVRTAEWVQQATSLKWDP